MAEAAAALQNTVRPPIACPESLRPSVDKVGEKLRKLLTEYEIPWRIQAKLGEEGYAWISDLAVRYEGRQQVLDKAPADFGFLPDSPGYSEAKSKLIAGRLASLIMATQTIAKERVEDVLHIQSQGEDYMAMLEQGDREAMLRAHAARCSGHRIDPDEQGSDHFLAMLKRSLNRGEIPVVKLKQIVPYMPEQGELEMQKRHHKEKTGETYVEESIKEPQEVDKWKRTMTIWRHSLLMAVAVCQNQPSVDLTKGTIDELYDEYLYGREIMKKSKPPSLSTMKIAERKFWREAALRLMKAKGKGKAVSMESIVSEIRRDTLFWQREVYDWCSKEAGRAKIEKLKKKPQRQWKVQKQWVKPKGGGKGTQGKGTKGKRGKGKKGKNLVCFNCGKMGHTAANCRMGSQFQQQAPSGAQVPPPPSFGGQTHRQMAAKGVDGKVPCRDFHSGGNCRFGQTCKFSHLCPVIKQDGSICGQQHRAQDHR